ncbi:unnamed protein product [Rotaria sp. Silwood1]|nr:unnamed protein product [Rotaria sp. Silwood1]
MDDILFHDALVFEAYHKDKEAINTWSKILENGKNIDRPTMVSVLIQRASCYYREKMYKEALVDFKEIIRLGYKIKENEQVFFMYIRCKDSWFIKADVIEELIEIELNCKLIYYYDRNI